MEALRALAERPGTPAEGEVAKKMLERHTKAQPANPLVDFLRGGDLEDFLSACEREAYGHESRIKVASRCACGAYHFGVCGNLSEHERIREEIRQRFPRGSRVYYNCWAYEKNCEGRVTGYPGALERSTTDPWNWLRIKFDHLKQARSVPVFDADGWHLSTVPIEDESLIWRLTNCYHGKPTMRRE